MAKHTTGLIESKRAPRRIYRRPIGVMIHGQYQVCQAQILSEDGILFEFSGELPAGTRVLCTFIMPGGKSIVVKAHVVDQKKEKAFQQIGAGFLNLDLNSRRQIRSYVAAKTLDEAAAEY